MTPVCRATFGSPCHLPLPKSGSLVKLSRKTHHKSTGYRETSGGPGRRGSRDRYTVSVGLYGVSRGVALRRRNSPGTARGGRRAPDWRPPGRRRWPRSPGPAYDTRPGASQTGQPPSRPGYRAVLRPSRNPPNKLTYILHNHTQLILISDKPIKVRPFLNILGRYSHQTRDVQCAWHRLRSISLKWIHHPAKRIHTKHELTPAVRLCTYLR